MTATEITTTTDSAAPAESLREFTVCTPTGPVDVWAKDLRDARGWAKRNVREFRTRRGGERLYTAEWERRRIRGQFVYIATLTNRLDGTTAEVRVVPKDVVRTVNRQRNTLRVDRCTCGFKGHCATCQMTGIGTDRTQATRVLDVYAIERPKTVRPEVVSAFTAQPPVVRDGYFRGVVLTETIDGKSGRWRRVQTFCDHDHMSDDEARNCAEVAAETRDVERYAPGRVMPRPSKTCHACDGKTHWRNAHDFDDDGETVHLHDECADALGITKRAGK